MNDLRTLALAVARCGEVDAAREDRSHPCHRVVGLQPEKDFQVPEGWAGNLRSAPICFISSNPSISTPPDGGSAEQAEDYPRSDWSDKTIADFTMSRFGGTWATPDGRHRQRNGTLAPNATPFWGEAKKRASEPTADADPNRDYVMTEIVHCKSKQEYGVRQAVPRCAGKHLQPILEVTVAPLVVVVGAAARRHINSLWSTPEGFGTREVNGRVVAPNVFLRQIGSQQRLVVYLTHFTSQEKVRSFTQTYGPGVEHLRALVAGHFSVEEAEAQLKTTVLARDGS